MRDRVQQATEAVTSWHHSALFAHTQSSSAKHHRSIHISDAPAMSVVPTGSTPVRLGLRRWMKKSTGWRMPFVEGWWSQGLRF